MVIEPDGPPDTSIEDQDTTPGIFFETAHHIFQEAEQTSGVSIERFYNIGGLSMRLCLAGSSLIPGFIQAIEHLKTEPVTKPALTVCIWDDVSTHTRMPPPPWANYAVYNPNGDMQSVYTRRGDVRGFNNDRFCTAYNWSAGALSMLDMKKNLALYWTHNARHLPSYEISAPLRTILHWFMTRRGLQFVHGGAVGTSTGGVLLAGKGGSGKSTTVLTCLNADMMYVSDDYCLITADPAPFAYSIYSSAKLNADNINRVPHLLPTLSNPDQMEAEKAVFFLYPYFAEKIATGFPVSAILLPRISVGVQTTLTPASPMEALKALALSTMSQLARAGGESVRMMHNFVQQLPCYHLDLGTDLTRIPDVIGGLIDERRRTKIEYL
jgi:hypothetical protein